MSQNGIYMTPMMPQFVPSQNKGMDDEDKKEIGKITAGAATTALFDHGTGLLIDAVEIIEGNLTEGFKNNGLSTCFKKITDSLNGLQDTVKDYVETNMLANPGIINLNLSSMNKGNAEARTSVPSANSGVNVTPTATGGRPKANTAPRR